ncbi:uncharacterized protein RCO7_15009 [Rhynchosporium graminicola]|uniref:Uncharacterized protein n=1 Tax=Rhynchosporium graminicola TaxID=2792576 RepID=A0A1E1LF01_9HELO|nr:uncharacterized protein RCO7_15009 [Rhynchosporium commune]
MTSHITWSGRHIHRAYGLPIQASNSLPPTIINFNMLLHKSILAMMLAFIFLSISALSFASPTSPVSFAEILDAQITLSNNATILGSGSTPFNARTTEVSPSRGGYGNHDIVTLEPGFYSKPVLPISKTLECVLLPTLSGLHWVIGANSGSTIKNAI